MRCPGMGVGALLSLCVAGNVQAQGGYLGLTAGQFQFDRAGLPQAEVPVVEVRVGSRINDWFTVEGRYGTGTAGEAVQVSGVPVNLEVEHYYGIYALGTLPLAGWLSVYGLAGVTAGDIELRSGGVATSGSDVDGSYGLGAELRVGEGGAVTLEWARLFDQSGYEVTTVTAGLAVDF